MFGTEYKSQSLEKALFDLKTQYISKEVANCRFFFMSKSSGLLRQFDVIYCVYTGGTIWQVQIMLQKNGDRMT